MLPLFRPPRYLQGEKFKPSTLISSWYALDNMYCFVNSVIGFWLVSTMLFLQSCNGADDLLTLLHKNTLRKAIRKEALKDYDTVVGPVMFTKEGTHPLEVSFMFSAVNLVDVNTKDQTVTMDGWVLQKWRDVFLSWDKDKFGGLMLSVFSPEEIWVPDTALFNNADRNEKLAGGREKFVTSITVFNSGQMVWLSPATFTSKCKQNVREWPMDTQVCRLEFGSYSYDSRQFKVVANPSVKYKKGSVSNGEWIIEDMKPTTETTDFNGCCGNFSAVVYTFTLSRKPTYFMFYMSPPVIVLVLLSLLSFFIPTESGERIGFVTTILLAMMVFLNIMPDYLPKTSDQVPILGTFLIGAMVIIVGVLIATIFILLCHHGEGTPPLTIRKMFLFSATKKIGTVLDVKDNKAMELEDALKDKTNKSQSQDAATSIPDKEFSLKDQEQISWQHVSKKLNWIFFGFICVVSTLALLVISVG